MRSFTAAAFLLFCCYFGFISIDSVWSQPLTCVFLASDTPRAVLDLSSIYGETLTYSDLEYDFEYTVCSNGVSCDAVDVGPVNVSLIQTENFKPEGDCFFLLKWDEDFVQPTYNATEKAFTFSYSNGQDTFCNEVPRMMNISWYCNPNVDYEIISIVESQVVFCEYDMRIESSLACIDPVMPTPAPTHVPPMDQCDWTLEANGDFHFLDLTSVKGAILSKVDSMNNGLIYTYSPCNNTLRCDRSGSQDIEVMSFIYNVAQSDCFQYLAQWDNGMVAPFYDPDSRVWQFTYTNGEECHGFQVIFQVYWICDVTAGAYFLQSVDKTDECNYKMNIRSALACN